MHCAIIQYYTVIFFFKQHPFESSTPCVPLCNTSAAEPQQISIHPIMRCVRRFSAFRSRARGAQLLPRIGTGGVRGADRIEEIFRGKFGLFFTAPYLPSANLLPCTRAQRNSTHVRVYIHTHGRT